jgi:hypothetical protein
MSLNAFATIKREKQIQADWNQSDKDSPAYIRNKPNFDKLQNQVDGFAKKVMSLETQQSATSESIAEIKSKIQANEESINAIGFEITDAIAPRLRDVESLKGTLAKKGNQWIKLTLTNDRFYTIGEVADLEIVLPKFTTSVQEFNIYTPNTDVQGIQVYSSDNEDIDIVVTDLSWHRESVNQISLNITTGSIHFILYRTTLSDNTTKNVLHIKK